jgi:hypothetical protein
MAWPKRGSSSMPSVGKFNLPTKGVGNMPSSAPKGGGLKMAPDDLFRSLAKLRLLQKYGRSGGFETLLGDQG